MLRIIAVLSLLGTAAAAQEKSFGITGITNIDVRNGVTVNVIQGDEMSITATARSGDVEQLELRKFGEWLAVNRHTRWFIFPYGRNDDIVVNITLPELNNIKAFGTAAASASGFTTESLRAEALEGGSVTVSDIAVPNLTLYATEGGALTVSGTCDTAVIEAIIDAQIMAETLTCANAAATTRSGGTLAITATDLASRDDTLGGTITLIGDPVIVDYLPGMEPEEVTADPEG